MVTHDTRLTDYCDRVFVMKDGVLEEKEHTKEEAESSDSQKEQA